MYMVYVSFQLKRFLLQVCLLLGAGLFAELGSGGLGVHGAGALGCLSVAFVAALKYRQHDDKSGDGKGSSEGKGEGGGSYVSSAGTLCVIKAAKMILEY